MEFRKKQPMKDFSNNLLGIRLSVLLIFIGVLAWSCTTEVYHKISGNTMGTYYAVTSDLDRLSELQSSIDSILGAINGEVSGYIEDSFISQFNHSDTGLFYSSWKEFPNHFDANFRTAGEIYKITGGAFDPTVMPLVNYWGFGYQHTGKLRQIDTLKVDSLMKWVGFSKVALIEGINGHKFISKPNAEVELDFSGIAKGYALDVLADFLEALGTKNFMIDIGGEIKVKGKNPKGQKWVIGINRPEEHALLSDVFRYIALSDMSMATSGNYRNYYEINGKTVSHTINPRSGFPERTNLLSATVLASDCITADALATAFMVLGVEASLQLVETLDLIEASFIILDENRELKWVPSSGFEKYLLN